jgi:drug/metabolite transporter (DMT)-like permease
MAEVHKSEQQQPINKTGLLNLLVIYLVWGSTYLAMRLAVRQGSGFTPFLAGFTRTLVAGIILLSYAALRKYRLRLTRRELLTLLAMSLLFWVFGNGLVMVGEIRADSGIAALIVAGTPVWVAIIQALVDRKLPSLLLVGSLLLGTAGAAVLSMPLLLSGVRADFLSVVAIMFGSISVSAANVLQSRSRLTGLAPFVLSGYQLLFAGFGFLVMGLVTGEPMPHPTLSAWMGILYLIVFGSLIAYTSFLRALQLLPTKIVSTYGYVNPIIAVFLGWLILNEHISQWTIIGAVFVLLSITGVFRDHSRDVKVKAVEAD